MHSSPYRAGALQGQMEQDKVGKVVKNNIIEPAITEQASPIVFAVKEYNSFRFLRWLWKTRCGCRMRQLPDTENGWVYRQSGLAEVFPTLDSNDDYWQNESDEADKDKTAIVTYNELYRYTRKRSGLKNASATYPHAVDISYTGPCQGATCTGFTERCRRISQKPKGASTILRARSAAYAKV